MDHDGVGAIRSRALREHASFTGAFVGVVAHDLTGQGWSADFTGFDYTPGI